MVPVKLVKHDEMVVHTLSGIGITPEGEQFAVYNLVGESGVMVQFSNDPRFRYKVLMKDCIAAIRDFHEEYRDELLGLTNPEGGEGTPGGAPEAPGPVDADEHDGAERRDAGV